METNFIFDIADLYKKTFGSVPYHVPGSSPEAAETSEPYQLSAKALSLEFTQKGSLLKEQFKGVEVWLPVRFYEGSSLLMHLPYSVVKISGKKTIVKTALPERKGTVKEQFNIDDYSISLKGFIIDEGRGFPEDQLEKLKDLYEKGSAVTLDNALTNIFLSDPELTQDEQRRVVINDLDIPEITGGRLHVRPFSMTLESDSVFNLEWEELV